MVVLRESADWMQVAVVVTVRQALQDVTPMVRAIRRNAMMIKFFFMIQTLLRLTIYGRTDLQACFFVGGLFVEPTGGEELFVDGRDEDAATGVLGE